MPTFIPVPGAGQANMRFTCEGQQLELVWNYSTNALGFPAASTAFVVNLASLWGTIKGVFSSNMFFKEVYCVDLSAEDGPVQTDIVGESGTDAGANAPLNVAVCYTLRTLQRGRSFRGRKYFSGIAAHNFVGSQVNAGVADSILAALQDFRDACVVDDCPIGVASRFHNGAPRTEGVLTLVSAISRFDNTVDSQRRRLPGRGT